MGRSGVSDTSDISSTEKARIKRKRRAESPKEKVGIVKGYHILQHAYGWTIDYIKGRWLKICPHTDDSCCWGSCFDRETCKMWDLRLYGLTRDMFIRFIEESSEDGYQREKRLYNVISLVMTGKPIITDKKSQPINVEQKKKDILYDFPYDVPYPSDGEINDNVNLWKGKLNDYKTKEDIPISCWDQERAKACKGDKGVIARRCSINDILWAEFKNGTYKDIQSLKNRVRLDYIRISLYPLSTPRQEICHFPPPVEFWKEIYEEGKLKEYVDILKKAGYTDITSVVPLSDELKLVLKHLDEGKPFPEFPKKEVKEPPKNKTQECKGPT